MAPKNPAAPAPMTAIFFLKTCLLYTSDAADERSSVDLGGRRIIKKKKITTNKCVCHHEKKHTHQEYHNT